MHTLARTGVVLGIIKCTLHIDTKSPKPKVEGPSPLSKLTR